MGLTVFTAGLAPKFVSPRLLEAKETTTGSHCTVPQPFVTSLVQGPNPADRSHQLWSLSWDE